jgi:hypothetical protein
MADNTAQREQARSNARFRKDKLKSDYDAYLAQLATQYGLSTESLSSNLEARGILRSGEAGTAVTRLAAANEANKTNAKSDYDYNKGLTRIDLLKELAALKSGTAVPAATATITTPVVPADPLPPVPPVPIAVAPTNIGGGQTYANTGVYGVVYPTPGTVTARPVRDAVPRLPRPPVTTPRPGTITFNPPFRRTINADRYS